MTEQEFKRAIKNHEMYLKDPTEFSKKRLKLHGNFDCYDFSNLDLSYADLSYCKFRHANFENTILYQARIFCSDLTNANFNNATCALTDFSYSTFIDAYMINTCLEDAKFYKANLSGAIGLLDPITFLNSKFTKTDDGYIAYKVFNCYHCPPLYWEIDEGSILVENVDFDRSMSCSYGINVTTLDNALHYSRTIYDRELLDHIPDVWKVLIKWEWLPLVVVPFNNATSDFRCGKVQLLEKVKVIK